MTSAEPAVLYSVKNGVATLTFNRPNSLNALSEEMRRALHEAMRRANEDKNVAAIVLTGKGKAFTAGLDLKELGSADTSYEKRQSAVGGTSLTPAQKPLIAAVNGYAVTGGFEVALQADFLIASEAARFADTHAQVGIVPGWGLSQKLPRLIGLNRAKELAFTGRFVDAREAERIGLVNRVVPQEQLLDVCQKLGEDIAGADQRTLATIRKITDEGYHTTLLHGMDIEARANAAHATTLNAAFLEERRKIVMARNRARTAKL